MKFARLLLALAVAGPACAGQTPEAAPQAITQAREIAARILPSGAIQKMMASMGDQFMGRLMDGMLDQNLGQFAGMAGANPQQLKGRLNQATMRDIIAITDPAFSERMARINKVMFAEMGNMMGGLEPDMREAMAQAYARSASPAELAAARAFYASPEGASFAAKQMQIMNDPAYVAMGQSMMSKIMAAMPGVMEKARQATADLPPPRTPAQLTPQERTRMQQLLGTTAAASKK